MAKGIYKKTFGRDYDSKTANDQDKVNYKKIHDKVFDQLLYKGKIKMRIKKRPAKRPSMNWMGKRYR